MSPEPDPQPINFDGVGDLDMLPGPAYEAVEAIYQAGKMFGPLWDTLAPSIFADEQVVTTGFDDLSVNFRDQYNPLKEAIGPIADMVERNFATFAQGGNDIIARYLELSDQIQPARMRSLE